MAELLADPKVMDIGMRKALSAVFQAFDKTRRPRTQWLVQSSRRSGDLYEWRADGVSGDVEKIADECRESNKLIWQGQISEMIDNAKVELHGLLSITT